MKYIILLTSSWNYSGGGINTFNLDFGLALGKLTQQTGHKVICISFTSVESGHVEVGKNSGVSVWSIDQSSVSQIEHFQLVRKALEKLTDAEFIYFVGHDSFTGQMAIVLSDERAEKSRSIVFHHMDYESYYEIKGDNAPEDVAKKLTEQRSILSKANYIIAVGPKLAMSALNKEGVSSKIFELIPGLQDIDVKNNEQKFLAIAFGRYDKRTDRLKQMRLAARSFIDYTNSNGNQLSEDRTLKIFGISSQEERDVFMKDVLKGQNNEIPYNNILTLPYEKDRVTLFNDLASSSVCLMLSIHEGFGLVGWEAIAAGVPLILSKNTGLYIFLHSFLNLDKYHASDFGICAVDIYGSMNNEMTNTDIQTVNSAFIEVHQNLAKFKNGTAILRDRLKEQYSWEQCAIGFLKILDNIEKELGTDIKDIDGIIAGKNLVIKRLNKEGNVQPILYLDIQEDGPEFVFRSRFVSITGREDEMWDLTSFSDSDIKFAWWTILGEGGMGKSRLALEHVIELVQHSNWYAGFISLENQLRFNWDNWAPAFNSFIIVDYASRNINQIIELLTIAKRISLNSAKKIRILLIERHDLGNWWSILKNSTTAGKVNEMWRPYPLFLEGLSDKDVITIISSYKYFNELKKTKTEVIKDLKKIPKYNVPLYCIMGISNMRNLKYDASTKPENIFQLYINREDIEIWQKKFQDNVERNRHKNLIAYITLIGGLNMQAYDDLVNQKLSFFPSDLDSEILHVLNLYDGSSDRISVIEPDLLGEYFINENYVKRLHEFSIKSTLKSIVELAWNNYPTNIRDFLIRFMYDLGQDNVVIFAPTPTQDATLNRKEAWCSLQIEILTLRAKSKVYDEIKNNDLLQELEAVVDGYEMLLTYKLRALIVITESTVKAKKYKKARLYIESLLKLFFDNKLYDNTIEVSHLFNSITRFAMRDLVIDDAEYYLSKLKSLDQIDKTILSSHFTNKIEREIGWYIDKKEQFIEADKFDFSHDISLKKLDQQLLNKEANALNILAWKANNGGDLENGLKYFTRLKVIAKIAPNSNILGLLEDSCQFNILMELNNGILPKQKVREYLSLSLRKYPENLAINSLAFFNENFAKIVRLDKNSAIWLLTEVKQIFNRRKLIGGCYNFYWEMVKGVIEYHLENFNVRKALFYFQQFEIMIKRFPEPKRDLIPFMSSSISLSVYHKMTNDKAATKYYRLGKTFGNSNFEIVYRYHLIEKDLD